MTMPYRPTSTETIIVTPYQWKKSATLLITEFARVGCDTSQHSGAVVDGAVGDADRAAGDGQPIDPDVT